MKSKKYGHETNLTTRGRMTHKKTTKQRKLWT